MLSDWERTSLADLERQLLMKDPKLARRFDRAARRAQSCSAKRPGGRYDWVVALVIGLALVYAAFAVLLGRLDEAVVGAVVAGCVAEVRHWIQLSRRLSGEQEAR